VTSVPTISQSGYSSHSLQVQMTDHMKKQKDFKKVQMRKFSAGDVPEIFSWRCSSAGESS